MGVLSLNKLFSKCFQEAYGKHYDVVIIDGSNIIFQTLASELSKLKKSSEIMQWKSINLDLMAQVSFITSYAIDDIEKTIDKYFERGVEEIILVLDPITTPTYTINTSYKYNHKYEFVLDKDLEKGINLDVNIKSEEQEKRKEAVDKSKIITETVENIHLLEDFSEEQKNILEQVFKQSFTFAETKQLLTLGMYVLMSVYYRLKDKNFKMISAIDEADLVIKNIAETFTDKSILVLSADTDYNILFGDNENVDTSSLMRRDVVYNPHKCWKALFADSLCCDYEHIIRLAPLFGNDYTIKKGLANAENFNDILLLFESNLNALARGSSVKRITKFAKFIVNSVENVNFIGDDVLDLDTLDEFLHNWDPEYFVRYYVSVIVYTNWDKYGRYEEIPKPSENTCNLELDKLLTQMWNNFGDKHVMYKWDPVLLFSDWDKFFKSIEEVEFNEPTDVIDYYCENEWKDEAGEFL